MDSEIPQATNKLKVKRYLFFLLPLIGIMLILTGYLFGKTSNKVVDYNEKATEGGKFSNAGIYLINQKAVAHFPEESAFSIEKDFFPRLLNHGFYGFVCEGDLIDIGTPERLQKAREVIRND